MNFSDENIRLILLKNNGYRKHTVYAGKDIDEDRYYTIADGKLFLRHIGKEKGKPYDRTEVCSIDFARYFLVMDCINHKHRRNRKLKL